MKRHYLATLVDIQLLANVTAQLDFVKSLLPAECSSVGESAALVNHAHITLMHILGGDVALVYAPDDTEKKP